MNTKLNLKQSLFTGLLAGIAAAIINAVLFVVFHVAGVISDNIFPQPGEPLTLLPVIMASVFPLLIGSFIFYLFERFTGSGFKIFAVIAFVLMALSLVSPFTMIPNVTLGYSLVLCLMHVAAALSLLYSIRRAKQGEFVATDSFAVAS
jgi:hypothetical protein